MTWKTSTANLDNIHFVFTISVINDRNVNKKWTLEMLGWPKEGLN